MLIVSSWSERFRKDIGFNGVSQIWGGRPAWYFWLADSPGVYQLEMMDAEEDTITPEGLCTAFFKVKCYPYQECSAFQSFSFLERKLVKSNLFDETNTPVFEHQDDIPDDLFTVATIEITMDVTGHTAIFSLESMAHIRTRFAQETRHVFPMISLDRTFGEQEIDRDVPGLQIGSKLFDCLMCLYSNAHKRPPLEIRCWRSPGYEFVIEDGCVHAREASNINGFKLNMLYSVTGFDSYLDMNSPTGNLKEGRENIIYDRRFSCGNFHASEDEKRLPMTLNRKWWSLAHTHYESELCSSCGCH